MNKLYRIMSNLTYVSIDRAIARRGWNSMTKIIADTPQFYFDNQSHIVSQKAVAGMLSHKQTRGFTIHRLKERMVNRKLNQTEGVTL